MKEFSKIDYLNRPDERKKNLSSLMQTGNLRQINIRPKAENHVSKYRLIMLILAIFILITGFYSIFF